MNHGIWTVRETLSWCEGYLERKGDENPRGAAQWLLSDATGLSRIELYTVLDRPLSSDERSALRDAVRRRGDGEPLQYITGKASFRYLSLRIAPGVLVPRPETEVLVSEAFAEIDGLLANHRRAEVVPLADQADRDLAASLGTHLAEPVGQAPSPSMRVLDLCTGSGCIACSIATERPHAHVVATDISEDAVALARRNLDDLGIGGRVELLVCDLDDALPADEAGSFDLVISNPPYIPTSIIAGLGREVTAFEPMIALDGGDDGLSVFRRILSVARRRLKPGGVLAVELHETCLDAAAQLAAASGFDFVRIAEDLARKPRVLIARMPDAS